MRWDGRIVADARHLPIASESVQCCVTSPPYWGLRSYDVKGDQIGLEPTPREYLNNIREVAFEVWRVLRKDGTFWLNLGDSYSRSQETNVPQTKNAPVSYPHHTKSGSSDGRVGRGERPGSRSSGFKHKDLIGIPWRVVFALQEDGWWLRSDIIWQKPNPLPESVTDRPTRSHEYIFLLTKSSRYYYNAEAIAEPASYLQPNSPQSIKSPHGQGFTRRAKGNARTFRGGGAYTGSQSFYNDVPVERESHGNVPNETGTRNKRSVWTISTQPYPEAHYATFPEEIPEICIKAGSKPGDLICDPFAGSGTVGRVAERLSRRWICCDLGYQDLQAKRLTNVQKELLAT